MSNQNLKRSLCLAAFVVMLACGAASAQTFTPELTPTAVTVTAGDPNGATFEAAINHDPGFSSSIRVSFAPLPAGVSISPSERFLEPPYNAVTFRVTATAAAPSGTHDATVIYSSSQTKTAILRVTVLGGSAPPPDFAMSIAPDRFDVPQGQTRTLTLTLTSINGFSGTVEVTSEHNAALLEVSPVSPFFVTLAPNATVTRIVTVRARDGAAMGSADYLLRARSGTLQKSIPVYPTITAGAPPADFNLAVSSPVGAVVAGQTANVTATIVPLHNFSGPVAISVSAPNNAVSAAPMTLTSPYVPAVLTLQIAPNSQGAVPVTFTATSGTLMKTTTITLNVQPALTPAFDLQLTPADLAVTAGQSGTVNVRVSGTGGFAGSVTVTSPAVSEPGVNVSFSPQSFVLSAGESRVVTIAVTGSRATPVPLMLEFRGTSGTLSDSAPFRLTIVPPLTGSTPSIQAIAPMARAPQPAQEFIVVGRNFVPGSTVTIEQPERGAIQVAGTRYISATQLAVTLGIQQGTPAGRGYRVSVRNPNGSGTAEHVVLAVAPEGSLGGPAAVTQVAIEYPIRGQVVSAGKGSLAAAHLATSGSGTIAGRWRLRQRGSGQDQGYVFDQFTATVAGGFMVSTDRPCFDAAGRAKTTAHVCASIPMLHRGTYQLELVIDQPRLATPASVAITVQSDSATELTVYRPRNEETIDAHDPEFSWTLVPGASQYNVEFVPVVGEDQPVPAPLIIETSRSTWRPDLRELRTRRGLTPGTYRWRVVAVYPGDLRGQVSPWLTVTFTGVAFTSARLVATVASAATSEIELPQEAPGGSSAPLSTYTIAPNATLTGGQGQDASGQFTVSSQGELGGELATSKLTVDLNYSGSADPRRLAQESRNWLIDTGTPEEKSAGFGAQFGYTTPDFTSGAEYLTSGSARTGVIGRARSRFGTFSYYQPVSTAIHGVMSGLDERLEIRSAAFETPLGKPYTFRVIALEVEEPANEDAGVIGSSLRTLGLYGRYDVNPLLSVVGEVARGTIDAEQGSGRQGVAARLGFTGTKGTFNYAANIRSVGANFVNPANRGLNPGAVSDRIALDMNVGKTLGRVSLSFGARRQDQGRSSESTMPRADETGFTAGLNTMLAGVAMNVSTNFTGSRGEGNALTFFPATRRDSSGVSTSLSRAFGRMNVSQTMTLQRTTDQINPISNQTMTGAGLTVSGSYFTNFSMSASLNGSRAVGAEMLGTTSSWTMSVQPSLALPGLTLSLSPSLSFSRSDNPTLALESESEQYNFSLQWSPAWMGNIIAAQVTSSWSRGSNSGISSELIHSYQASVTVRANKERGMPWFATGPMPGTVSTAAPQNP